MGMVGRRPRRVRARGRGRGDGGSAIVVLVLVVLVAVVALGLVVGLADRAVQRARAQNAADAAALAGVVEGPDGAADLAERNGARLVDFVSEGPSVLVVVTIGDAVASARAELRWDAIPHPGR